MEGLHRLSGSAGAGAWPAAARQLPHAVQLQATLLRALPAVAMTALSMYGNLALAPLHGNLCTCAGCLVCLQTIAASKTYASRVLTSNQAFLGPCQM